MRRRGDTEKDLLSVSPRRRVPVSCPGRDDNKMRTINELISDPLPRPVVIAHRGASHYCQENTMKAFQAAVDMSAEMIEFDVRRAGDPDLRRAGLLARDARDLVVDPAVEELGVGVGDSGLVPRLVGEPTKEGLQLTKCPVDR